MDTPQPENIDKGEEEWEIRGLKKFWLFFCSNHITHNKHPSHGDILGVETNKSDLRGD